jgi:DNA-binding transcriptional ArsR family regulator
MRALAHPVRLAILDLLRTTGNANATECARRLGESAQACSYHLRSLAKWGILRNVASGDARETRWELASRGVRFSSGEQGTPAYEAAAAALQTTVLERDERIVTEFLARQQELPEKWRHATLLSGIVYVTLEELDELGRRLDEVTKDFEHRTATDKPEGARRVDVMFRAIPKVGE